MHYGDGHELVLPDVYQVQNVHLAIKVDVVREVGCELVCEDEHEIVDVNVIVPVQILGLSEPHRALC